MKIFIWGFVSIVLVFLGLLLGSIVWQMLNSDTGVCTQGIQEACFLRTPLCVSFGNACNVAPLWTPRECSIPADGIFEVCDWK